MKKTRIAAWLLSAVLAVTSLPVTVPVTAEVGDASLTETVTLPSLSTYKSGSNVADEVTPAEINGTAGNKYLTVYNRNNNLNGVHVKFTDSEYTADKIYTLSFDVRTYVDYVPAGNNDITPMVRLSFASVTPDYTDSGFNSSTRCHPINDSWQTLTINFKITSNTPTIRIETHYTPGAPYVPHEIDNIKIVSGDSTFVDEDFTDFLETYNIEEITANTTYGNLFMNNNASFAIQSVETYYKLQVADTESISVSPNIELDPGSYTYSIKLRNGEYQNSTVYQTKYDNTFTAYVKATTSAGVYGVAANAVTVSEDWQDVTLTFDITEKTTLTNLDIVLDHNVDGHETITAHMKNASLTFVPADVTEAIAAIAAIGTVAYTDACKALIDAAQSAYDAVADSRKAKVSNYNVLTAAVAEYGELKASAERLESAGDAFEALEALEEVNLDAESVITAAREAYDELTAKEKAEFSDYTYETLEKAEAELAALKADLPTTVIHPDSYKSGNTYAEYVRAVDGGNKYLTTYQRDNNWRGVAIKFDVDAEDVTDGKEDYTLTFDMRVDADLKNLNTDTIPKYRVKFYNPVANPDSYDYNSGSTSLYDTNVELSNGWNHITIPLTAKAAGSAAIVIMTTTNITHIYPFELDNIKLIKNSDSSVVVNQTFESFDSEDVAAFTEFKNDGESGAVVAYDHQNKGTLYAIDSEESYYKVNVTSGESFAAEPNAALKPGIYTYTVKLRNGEFDAQIKPNTFKAYAKAHTADGALYGSAADAVEVGERFTELTFNFSVAEETTLDKLEVVLTHDVEGHDTIIAHIKDSTLTCDAYGELTGDIKTSLDIPGKNFTTDAGIAAEETLLDVNYLAVTDRGYNLTGVAIDFEATINNKYRLTFDIRNHEQAEAANNTAPKYRVVYYAGGDTSKQYSSLRGDLATTNTWMPVEDVAVYTADVTNPRIMIIGIGDGNQIHPFDIKNIKVMDVTAPDTPVTVVNETFEGLEGELTAGKTYGNVTMYNNGRNVTYTVETESTYYTLDVENGRSINVNLDTELIPGIYTYTVKLKNTADGKVSAYAEAVTANKTYTSDATTTVGSIWTELTFTFTVEKATTLDTLKVYIDSADADSVKIAFKEASLSYDKLPEEGGRFNPGIIMVLIAKKKGEFGDKTVGYIENGGFNEPVTVNDVITNDQTAEDAGWYAKLTPSSGTTIKQVTERGNTFLRVANVTSGQRGVFFNTGVTLQPGTYALSAYLRVSERAEDGSIWRDTEQNTMQMRVNLQNPAIPNSPHYVPNNGVDKDTSYDALGNAIGTLTVVSRDWTHYTDTIVVEEPTLAVFKIGGGIGGAADAHGFDIDNFILAPAGTEFTPEAPIESDEAVTEPVKETDDLIGVNLIVNGDFSAEPKIEAGAYNAAVTDTWFRHSGMDYAYGADGISMKDQPKIMHEMNLTWADGYMTLTGREYNLKPVSITPSTTLTPGVYRFSIDYKTPNKGETTVSRVYIYTADGSTLLFNPGASNVANVTDKWSTFTCEFAVTSPTAVKINLSGGPNASFIQDYCFDNVVLEKVS